MAPLSGVHVEVGALVTEQGPLVAMKLQAELLRLGRYPLLLHPFEAEAANLVFQPIPPAGSRSWDGNSRS